MINNYRHTLSQHHALPILKRRQDDGIGERKRRKQPSPAQHQPGFISVPNRGDAVHRLVALLPDRKTGKENTDAKIEAVHDDIGRRTEETTSELQSLNRHTYAIFCFKKKTHKKL